MGRTTVHDFYCLNCGRRGLPLQRQESLKRSDGHRKKLYCFWCKATCNHIECKTQEDVINFQEKFENGEYKEEAKVSMKYCN